MKQLVFALSLITISSEVFASGDELFWEHYFTGDIHQNNNTTQNEALDAYGSFILNDYPDNASQNPPSQLPSVNEMLNHVPSNFYDQCYTSKDEILDIAMELQINSVLLGKKAPEVQSVPLPTTDLQSNRGYENALKSVSQSIELSTSKSRKKIKLYDDILEKVNSTVAVKLET